MSSSVVSKNLFDLLGNDEEETPSGPVKTVDKTATNTVKRNTDGQAPSSRAAAPAGTRRGGFSGNEAAFRDRNIGSDRNRGKSTDDAPRGGLPRGGHNARVRGGRGSRFPRDRDDRHTKSAPSGGTDKTAAQGWGATEGQSELKDEQAGEEIAQTEQKEAAAEDADNAALAEPEDKSVSFADYLAQKAEKKLALNAERTLAARKANEGSKLSKKWETAKELVKEEGDEFISGSGPKAKRERERKVKQLVDIDHGFVEPERTRGGRGGRGGSRGDSTRGSGRGDSARGAGRGRGGRGEFRGNSEFRGGRGGNRENAPLLNPNDTSAFPSLGK